MYLLDSLHTFNLPSSAQKIFHIGSHEELIRALDGSRENTYYVLGEGSNTVFLEDYLGAILKIELKGVSVQQTSSAYRIKAAAGENWHQLVVSCLQKGIYGLENLALIPGSVGAAPIQNIGAYGLEIDRFIEAVEYLDCFDGQIKQLDKESCEFGYRDSIFKKCLLGRAIITHVLLSIPKENQRCAHYGELAQLSDPSPQEIFDKVVDIRKRKLPDPLKIPNAGSFFKNPVIDAMHYSRLKQTYPTLPGYPVDSDKIKIPAAWLIEQLGFKGIKKGGIACHANQPLVLTNDGTGTGEQLLDLAKEIVCRVQNEFSIFLENEVRLIGKNGPVFL